MRFRTSLLAVATLIAPVVAAPLASGATFSDVPSYSEFADAISQLADAGIVSGITPTLFGPTLPATRGELAKIVMKASGRNVPPMSTSRFSDVPVGSTLHLFIEAAASQGVIAGFSDGTFRPNVRVTRAEAAKMIVRAFALPTNALGGPHFRDVPSFHSLYVDVESAYNAQIISGFGDGTFHPDDTVLRQHLAKMVARALFGVEGSTYGGLRFEIEPNADELAPDGLSTTTITVEARKPNGKIDQQYDEDVTFTTTDGIFEEGDKKTYETEFESGRAQATLVAGTREGTARISAKVNNVLIATTTVEFTDDEPRLNDGRGSDSVSGVGTMTVVLYDHEILTTSKASLFPTNFTPVAGGATLIEAFVHDSNGDPITGDRLRATITHLDGRLENGAFPTTGPSSGTNQRSVDLVDEGNGRYLGWYQAVTDQIPGKLTVEVVNLTTSPSLSAAVSIQVENPEILVQLTQNELLTSRIGGSTPDIRNRAQLLIETLDEHGHPVALADNADAINVRVVDGPVGDAYLGTVTANSATVSAQPVLDINGMQIPGLYTLAFTAGSSPGRVKFEVRANDAIGQPRTTVELTTKDPKLDAMLTSTTVAAGQTSAVLVRVVDGDDVPVLGETLQANIQSGVGTLSSTTSGTANTVTLDSIPTAPGFYMATFIAPGTVATSQSTQIRVTDVSRTTQIQEVLTAQVVASNNIGTPRDVILSPLRTGIGALDSVPMIITVRDTRGTGVVGIAADIAASIVVGQGTITPPVEIGGGAYATTYSANRTVGNVRTQVRVTPSSGGAAIVKEASFNIADNEVMTEPVDDTLLIDEGSGIITYVRDEDGVPIPGLLNPGFTPPTVGNVTFSNITEIDPNILGVGSGVYIVGVDSSALTPPGTVSVRVTEIGAATSPHDTAVFEFKDVSVELEALPSDDLLSDTCTVLIARVRDEHGDPVNGAEVQIEITSGSGELFAGNETSCPDNGTTRVTVGDSEGPSSTDDMAGVYIATFRAPPVEENVTILARVINSATQVEDDTQIRVR